MWDDDCFVSIIQQISPTQDALSRATAGRPKASNLSTAQLLKEAAPFEKLVAESVFVMIVVCP
ncbi:MAG: hypothetical protein AB7Q37_03745 [Pyrinomonadaceae bacterium]